MEAGQAVLSPYGTEAEQLVTLSVEQAREAIAARLQAAIEHARTFDELRRVGDQAEALRRMFAAVHGFTEAQNECAYRKLLVQRALGELLAQTVRHAGGRPAKQSPDVTVLPEGVTKMQSSRWQQLAAVPPATFEAHVAEVRATGEELTTAGVLRLAKELRREPDEQKAPAAPPPGTYSLLLADPPWQYDPGTVDDTRVIENQYRTLPLRDISELQIEGRPVWELAAPNAVLFLWSPVPKLVEAVRVVDAWGFTYRTAIVWHKQGRLGLGYYARQNVELLLIGTRGQPGTPEPADRPVSPVEAPVGRHSEKPCVFYDLIERMYPHARRLELFARSPRDGWDAWGDEV